MKKILLGITGMILALTINAQTKPATAAKPAAAAKPATAAKPAAKPASAGKPTTTTATKPVAKTTATTAAKPAVALKTPEDSLSYAIGILDGNFFKTQGVTSVNPTSLAMGFRDAMQGKAIFTPEQADQVLRGEMQKMMRKKIQPNIDMCNDFLTQNAKKAGVKLVMYPKENNKDIIKIKERNKTLLNDDFRAIEIESFNEAMTYVFA